MPGSADADEFFEETFRDALVLVEALRDLIVSSPSLGLSDTSDPVVRVTAAREMSRLTNRAAAAVSLLLLHKALLADQAEDIADPTRRLNELYSEAVSVGLDANRLSGVELPEPLQALLLQADDVFARMPRLHAMIEARLAA
jgi:hypothetical protein